MQHDQKNLVLAIVLSVAIIFVFNVFFLPKPDETAQRDQQQTQQQGQQQTQQQNGQTTLPGDRTGLPTPDQLQSGQQAVDREHRLARDQRVPVETPRLVGSINLRGGVIDDITMRDYRQEVEPDSPKVHLLQPRGGPGAYYAQLGWQPTGGSNVAVPGSETVWQVDGNAELHPGQPVTLVWTNPDGLRFERLYRIDRNYMITVTQTVRNTGSESVSMAPYAVVRRQGEPETLGFFILHEGPIAATRDNAESDGVIDQKDYSDIQDDPVEYTSLGGWFGMSDHYWLVAVIPQQSTSVRGGFLYLREGQLQDTYQAGYVTEQAMTVAPGGSASWNSLIFAGAKEVDTLQAYVEELGIAKLDWAIDFGWFWFFTRPFLDALKFLFGVVGNFGVAILILTILIKLLFFPLANKSYRSMSKMKALQPKMQSLKEQYGDDKQRLNQEMMALYKQEKVNPAAGCLPILIQIPVFFALYKVLFVAIEMRHAPFFGWVQDLSAPDPTSILNLFGLAPWNAPELGLIAFLSIGVWPILMGITMWMQQKLNPAPPDPVQQKIFMLLPIVFTFVLAKFPAGLVIYWSWNNILSIGQQYIIMRRAGVRPGGRTVPKPAPKPATKTAPAAATAPQTSSAETAPSPGDETGSGSDGDAGTSAPRQAPKGGKRGRKRSRRR